jgi:hypothetical protein
MLHRNPPSLCLPVRRASSEAVKSVNVPNNWIPPTIPTCLENALLRLQGRGALVCIIMERGCMLSSRHVQRELSVVVERNF